MWNNNLRSSLRLEVPLEHPLVRRALEDPVDRVVVADRRRDGLGPVDHDLRGVRVPERRHQPGALATQGDANFCQANVQRCQTGVELTPNEESY